MDTSRQRRTLAPKWELAAYVAVSLIWMASCIGVGLYIAEPTVAVCTSLELLLIVLVFIGIPERILREHIFLNWLIFSSFRRACMRRNIECINREQMGTSDASLLAYWADVVLVLAAIRLLQWTEGAVPRWSLDTFWLGVLFLYWFRAVHWLTKGSVGIALDGGEVKLTADHIHQQLGRLAPILVLVDCMLWTALAFIALPPSGIVVVGLFLMTANPLIEQLTKGKRPLREMVRPANLWQVTLLLFLAGLAILRQTQPTSPGEQSQILSSVFDHRFHGYAYGLIVYVGVIIVAVWRSAEKQGQQYRDLDRLWRTIQATVHDTKNEAQAIRDYDLDVIRERLDITASTRIGNMIYSVLGMWLMVKKEWHYQLSVEPVAHEGHIMAKAVRAQLQSILESAIRSERKCSIRKGLDFRAFPTAKALIGEGRIEDVASRLIFWESCAPEWKLCKHNNTSIPDGADVGLLYACIAEIIRNALRHSDPRNPKFSVRVFDGNGLLNIAVTNSSAEELDPEHWEAISNSDSTLDDEGLTSLVGTARAFGLWLRFHVDPEERHAMTVYLGVNTSCPS